MVTHVTTLSDMSPINDKNRISRRWLAAFFQSDLGMSITEYAVAAGLIAAALTVSFTALGVAIVAIIVTVVAFM